MQSLISKGTSPQKVVAEVAALGNKFSPHPAWSELGNLDLETEQKTLHNWLRHLLRDEPFGPEITTLWFGLFNAGLEDDSITFMLYLGGSAMPRESSDFNLSYFPEGRYFESKILDQIYQHSETVDELGNLAEYGMGLGYAGAAVAAALESPEVLSLMKNTKPITVLVGFDEGDYLDVGTLMNGEFERFQQKNE